MREAAHTAMQLGPESPNIPAVMRLIRDSFAYMEGRIDPPSSMHRLSEIEVRRQAQEAEVWTIGERPDAVMFLTPKPKCLYLSKLAVDTDRRGVGLARCLVDMAKIRAKALGLPVLELQTRIELVENHAAFARMGFRKTAESAHPGYDRATFITMQRRLD